MLLNKDAVTWETAEEEEAPSLVLYEFRQFGSIAPEAAHRKFSR